MDKKEEVTEENVTEISAWPEGTKGKVFLLALLNRGVFNDVIAAQCMKYIVMSLTAIRSLLTVAIAYATFYFIYSAVVFIAESDHGVIVDRAVAAAVAFGVLYLINKKFKPKGSK